MVAHVPPEGWLDEVPVRHLLDADLETRFPLLPGDRPLVEPGSAVLPGDPLLEHLRDRRIDEVVVRAGDAGPPLPGQPLGPGSGPAAPGPRDRRGAAGARARQGRPLAPGHGRPPRGRCGPPWPAW